MPDPFQPQKWTVPTVLKGRINVQCPICGHDEFLPNVPVDIKRAQREGFRNVVVGVYGDDGLAALPVNFRHCANCGYVLNFVLGKFSDGEKA